MLIQFSFGCAKCDFRFRRNAQGSDRTRGALGVWHGAPSSVPGVFRDVKQRVRGEGGLTSGVAFIHRRAPPRPADLSRAQSSAEALNTSGAIPTRDPSTLRLPFPPSLPRILLDLPSPALALPALRVAGPTRPIVHIPNGSEPSPAQPHGPLDSQAVLAIASPARRSDGVRRGGVRAAGV